MKKRLLSLLLAAVLLLSVLPAAEASDTLASEQDVLAFLAVQKALQAETFAFVCEQELFQRLLDDNAAALSVLLVKGGVEDMRIQCDARHCTIRLTGVTYTDRPWVVCGSETEALLATRRLLAQGNRAFALLCSPELTARLAESGLLRNSAAQEGFGEISLAYYASGIVQARDPQLLETPWAAVGDAAQFGAAIESLARAEAGDFLLVFEPAFFAELKADEEFCHSVHAASLLERYTCRDGELPCTMRYSRVSYTQAPCMVCACEDDVRGAIPRMGSLELSAFSFYLASDALRAVLIDRPTAYVHALESHAGLLTANVSHKDNVVRYQGAVVPSHFRADALETPEDAAAFLDARLAAGEPSALFFCSEELYDQLLGAPDAFDASLARTLIAQAGIGAYTLYGSRTAGAVTVLIRGRSPAAEILSAVHSGSEDTLTDRQREALALARQIAADCAAPTERETALRVHDALCERLVIAEGDALGADGGAVGALLEGRADAQGYAEAYALVGSLAGLELRCQTGKLLVTLEASQPFRIEKEHVWNLLKLDGSWRAVDLYLDDAGDEASHSCFDLDYEQAAREHRWCEAFSPALQGQGAADRETP